MSRRRASEPVYSQSPAPATARQLHSAASSPSRSRYRAEHGPRRISHPRRHRSPRARPPRGLRQDPPEPRASLRRAPGGGVDHRGRGARRRLRRAQPRRPADGLPRARRQRRGPARRHPRGVRRAPGDRPRVRTQPHRRGRAQGVPRAGAAKEALVGTVDLVGTPAEEGGGGKIRLLEAGAFEASTRR